MRDNERPKVIDSQEETAKKRRPHAQDGSATTPQIRSRRRHWLLAVALLFTTLASPVLAAADEAVAYYYADPISAADLQGMTLRELALIRNTIFARAGNPFRKKWLREYFEAQAWYTAQKEMDRSLLTETDWQNAKVVAEREAAIGSDELNRIRDAILGRIAAGESRPEDTLELRLIAARIGEPVEGAPQEEIADRSPLEDLSMLDEQLTKAQLDDLSRRDLRILRNTIYARHGYMFKSELLQIYFGDTSWYEPDPEYTDKRLTKVDWRNIKLIKSVEKELGGPLKDKEQMEEEGWFAGA